MIDYNQLPDDARVWVYQSNKTFSKAEAMAIKQIITDFVNQWQSHGKQVRAWGELKYNRFVILAADEKHEAPSGCSIDSSVAMIKEIEQNTGADMFNRMHFSYKKGEDVLSADRLDFANLYQQGEINDQTIVFDNLIKTKADLDTKWEVALADSWHARMV